MKTFETRAPRRPAMPKAAILAATLGAVVLAGCSSGHVGESWQCPLATGGSCGSVAAVDPAVPETSGGTVLDAPLWRQRGGAGGLPEATACTGGCGDGSGPFGWFGRLLSGGDNEDRDPARDAVATREDSMPDAAASLAARAQVTGQAGETASAALPADPRCTVTGRRRCRRLAHGRGRGADLDRALRRRQRRLPRGGSRPGRAGARRVEDGMSAAAGSLTARLLELFEGQEAPGPWSPPEMPAALHSLLPWRAFDEASGLYVNAASAGFVMELPPFAGIDGETLGALAGTLADAAPERCTVQVIHWASPRFGHGLRAWAAPRRDAGGALARMGEGRKVLLAPGGWRRLHAGGPPFTLSDHRVFLTACLASGPEPRPATETALGAFRRALEGTLASAGAQARRLEPDALLSLAAELVAPDVAGIRDGGTERPHRRWSPRDPIHEQCAAPGRAMTVRPTGLAFHHPDGEDVAVRVLSAVTFPEVWPGWRGNALIGDFHRDFLQPGCPVLTCLTVVTGDEAAGERAFLKSARAIQQAGTGLARYLPGLPEKARDWQAVTERLKDGERLVRACYSVAVYARMDGLDEAEQAVRAIYHGQGWRVTAERYVQLPSWLACLPMASAGGLEADMERMGRMKTLLTSSPP